MLSPTLQFDVTPTQQQLLHAYQAQAAALKVTTEEFDGWLERIDELSGVDMDQLTGLHGQLIAAGMLKFEISGRNVGLRYQLSQQGKKAIEVASSSASIDGQPESAEDKRTETDSVETDSVEMAEDESAPTVLDTQASAPEHVDVMHPTGDGEESQPPAQTIETSGDSKSPQEPLVSEAA